MLHRHVAPDVVRFAALRSAALVLAILAFAATPAVATDATHEASAQTQSEPAPVPLRWVPEWLMDSLTAAIADATDTRDRHAGVEP